MRNRGVYSYKRRRVSGWPIWSLRVFKREIRKAELRKKRLHNHLKEVFEGDRWPDEMRVVNQITMMWDHGELVEVSLL